MDHVSVLLASAAALPRREDMGAYFEDVARAEARGYFMPDEDERIREIYSRYLAVRTSLLDCLQDLSKGQWSHQYTLRHAEGGQDYLKSFVVAYAAACMLVRAASYLIELTEDAPVTRKKLDEAEPRFHIERKSFTTIYKSLTSARRWWGFYDATRFYQKKQKEVLTLASDPELGPVVELLQAEMDRIKLRRREFLKRHLGYRLHSFFRRQHSGYQKTMFSLFELTGCQIAELKQPFVKPSGTGKRVDEEVRARLEQFLKPGDVLVTRHDDALSNLFLPGFWPHAAYYIGSNAQRAALGVNFGQPIDEDVRFLEAKKDGVRLRPVNDTLQVDALIVLRPKIPESDIARAIERGLSHAGKLYDFIFDFTTADRLVCTEVVYRSYHSVGPVHFELEPHAGRYCLSAEALINQSVSREWFEPVLVYGLDGNQWIEGPEAKEQLRSSFASAF